MLELLAFDELLTLSLDLSMMTLLTLLTLSMNFSLLTLLVDLGI